MKHLTERLNLASIHFCIHLTSPPVFAEPLFNPFKHILTLIGLSRGLQTFYFARFARAMGFAWAVLAENYADESEAASRWPVMVKFTT
jgi:hypothetical protein